jgi:acyl dehydratase
VTSWQSATDAILSKEQLMSAVKDLVDLYQDKVGVEVHLGEWLTVDQERIDAFARATGDMQWIHIDPIRAHKESPYRATIAHGFLTLSLLPLLTESNTPGVFEKNYPGMKLRVNYGLEKVRFPAPVVVGSRVRSRTVVTGVEAVTNGVQIAYRITIEIEGGTKPACVVEQLFRLYP